MKPVPPHLRQPDPEITWENFLTGECSNYSYDHKKPENIMAFCRLMVRLLLELEEGKLTLEEAGTAIHNNFSSNEGTDLRKRYKP